MSAKWIIMRTCLAMLAIFACGIWVGRITAPEIPDDPVTLSAHKPAATRATKRAIRRYRKTLQLTPDQMEKLRPHFIEVGEKMAVLPKRSKPRLWVLEQFHQDIAPHLTPAQLEKAEHILQGAREKKRRD